MFKRKNNKTKDLLSNLIYEIKNNPLNKPIPKYLKEKGDRFLNELSATGYILFVKDEFLNNKNPNYSDYTNMMCIAIYYYQLQELKEDNFKFFVNVSKDGYGQALEELSKVKKVNDMFDISIVYSLLNAPLLGYNLNAYLVSLALKQAEDFKKLLLTLIDNNISIENFKSLFIKQQKAFVNVNDSITGCMVDFAVTFANQSFVKAGIDNNFKKIRFIAQEDSRTTRMCQSLNNQIFYTDDINVFERYSENAKGYIKYKIKGLKVGVNLPPINDSYHHCRSTFTYDLSDDIARYTIDSLDVSNSFDKEQFSRYEKYYGDEVPNNQKDFTDLKLKDTEKYEKLKKEYFKKRRLYNQHKGHK